MEGGRKDREGRSSGKRKTIQIAEDPGKPGDREISRSLRGIVGDGIRDVGRKP
jgi:hypothetical protein